VRFTADARFVISGSDDTNIRIWKAVAAEPLKTLVPREQQKLDYRARLKERYKHMPEIKRIARHRHVPKAIYNASKLKGVMKKAADRKQKNVSAHSKETAKPKAERRKHIITQEE
jgi:WD repeat and SOF domain-containing protein 1